MDAHQVNIKRELQHPVNIGKILKHDFEANIGKESSKYSGCQENKCCIQSNNSVKYEIQTYYVYKFLYIYCIMLYRRTKVNSAENMYV